VGDGPLRTQLAARAERLGLGHRVRFTGAQPPDGVRDELERADVLAMPCVVAPDGDRDAMPVVVKEALAMEVPVVASDEVGLPELVADGWGRLFAPGDPHALARALEEILDLPVKRRVAMGRAGRAHVLAACAVATEAERLSALVDGPPPRVPAR
jgi:glycosyltransferase involved in cell wall biosynthesis